MQFTDSPLTHDDDSSFSAALIGWQKAHGRHDLPWQNTRDAYRIWLSEIMLQQTQVATVIPYYLRFLDRFPTVFALATAPLQEIMESWSGLGYYSRARNLHRCARQVVEEHGGIFPSDPKLLADLPGIGRSTAAAIAAFSYGVRAAILDGNVIRVFSRVFGITDFAGNKPVKDALWRRAETMLPSQDIEAYTQGLMDLGATVCTRSKPHCTPCPFSARCMAFAEGKIDEFPVRKPKKSLPERWISMLAITHENRILLEQRPGKGVWGGLLSLPEVPLVKERAEKGIVAEEDAVAIEKTAVLLGASGVGMQLPSFTHTFSHFRLHIIPYRTELTRLGEIEAQAGYVWFDLDRIEQAPLPSPVKKWLIGLRNNAA